MGNIELDNVMNNLARIQGTFSDYIKASDARFDANRLRNEAVEALRELNSAGADSSDLEQAEADVEVARASARVARGLLQEYTERFR